MNDRSVKYMPKYGIQGGSHLHGLRKLVIQNEKMKDKEFPSFLNDSNTARIYNVGVSQ